MARHQFNDRPKEGSDKDLFTHLRGIDGSSYGAYKRVLGQWHYPTFTVILDRIQADPFAPPSAVRIQVAPETIGLPSTALAGKDQRLATADFIARTIRSWIDASRSSSLSIARVGQEILERSSVTVDDSMVEIRLQVKLPARGRTILGKAAAQIFSTDIPALVAEALAFDSPSLRERLIAQVKIFQDFQALNQALLDNDWVSFIADGAMLARRSGVSQLPLEDGVPFTSPQSLQVTVNLPHSGEITGLAIRPGLTLIVGGGYHGKSTVLSAIERGVYAHIPGDGRELVATRHDAMKVRAADGRPVTKVDVSPFINHLPFGADTTHFSTQNASGSTSQAASIIEAVEAGSSALLIDEDTSATNLMIRDSRMRALVAAKDEPITPLIDRISGLCADRELSVVMVMGGSGAYLDVADYVLQMNAYHCSDVTEQAREVAAQFPRPVDALPGFPDLAPRPIIRLKEAERTKVRTNGCDTISVDRDTIDVSDVEQIVDPGQTEAIAWALRGMLFRLADGSLPLAQLAQKVEERLSSEGLDALSSYGARRFPAFLVRPRLIDIVAAANRLRSLQVLTVSTESLD